jgi:predicted ATP-grasp superfamily ATP-dependent carboligase
VLEVNPRYTASVEVLERARAMACLAYHVDACAGRRLPDRSELRPTGAPGLCGKAIVYARRRLVVAEGFPHWAISARDDDGWPLIADIPQAGSVVETGGPIATVMAAGSTAEEVEATLRQRADELRRRLDDSPT